MKKFLQTACAAVVIMMCAAFSANAQEVANDFTVYLKLATGSKSGNSTVMKQIPKTTFFMNWKSNTSLYCQQRVKTQSSVAMRLVNTDIYFEDVCVYSIDNNVIIARNLKVSGVDTYITYTYPKEKLIPTQDKLTAIKPSGSDVWEPAKIIKAADGGIKIQSIVKGSNASLLLKADAIQKIQASAPDWVKATFEKKTFPFK